MNAIVPKILEGELLGPRDDVRVVAAQHPFRQEHVERRFPAGTTLAEMVEAIANERDCRALYQDFVVHIDGHTIAPAIWHLVRPKPCAVVTMQPTVEGFLAPLFGAIGTLFSGFQAFIAGAGIFGKILMAGLSLGVQLLFNAIFAPRPPKQETPKIGYSFTGARNQSAPFEAVPTILGRHRMSPFYGGLPYTETVGTDQYLRCLFIWGYAYLDVDDIRIGETPLSSFQEVDVETYHWMPGDPGPSLYPSQVVEEQFNIKLLPTMQVRTTADNINYISLDIVFPNGLTFVTSKGKNTTRSVIIEVLYRAEGTDDWLGLDTFVASAASRDTLRFTSAKAVPAGKYEVRVARLTPEWNGDDTVVEDCYWTALRGFRPGSPITFSKPLTITAIRIKATSQLNGTLDTLNGVVTSYIASWDGAAWVSRKSRNPADLYRHVLQGPANPRPRSDAEIDLAALQAWAEYCTARGWTFDHPRITAEGVYDTLLDVCAAGRAMPVFKDGKWSVIWDEQDTPVVQMFTPRNSWGFEAVHKFNDLPHGWRIKFINEAKGWVDDERIVYDDGYSASNATKFEGLELPGVTNADAVWKHGRFHLAQLRLRPETYTLNVDFENLLCTRADRVRVAHDVMLVGQISGRVRFVDAATQTVTTDELVTFASGASYVMRFRLADGTMVLRSVVDGSGETDTVQLDGAGDLPAPGDLWTFGESSRETIVCRILSIEPLDDLAAKLTLVDDAPGIYDADSGAVPAFESNVTAPIDPYTLPPSDLLFTSSVYLDGDAFLAAVKLSWKQPRQGRVRSYEVEYSAGGGTWRPYTSVTAPQTTAELRGLVAGSYTFRVRAIFDDDTFSRWIVSETFGADALLVPPPDVTGFKIATLGDLSTLSWTAVPAVGISHYEIRFVSAESLLVSWNTATPLIPEASGTSVQVAAMVGSYLIKAVYRTGLKSLNAAVIESDIAALAGLNVIETFVESPDFAGAKQDVFASDGRLRLLANNTMDKWGALDDVVSLYAGTGSADSLGTAVAGIYSFDNSLDLGAVYTSRLTALVEAQGENLLNVMATWTALADLPRMDDSEPEEWSVALQYRKSMVDPGLDEWSDWLPFVVGDVTARALQFRLILTGLAITGSDPAYSNTTPVVSRLKVSIDMPDRVVAGNDIVVPTAGLTVSFDPPFISLQGLATADQDMATGDRKEITDKGAAGFTIRFFNSTGTAVERTIDYVAKGYGTLQ